MVTAIVSFVHALLLLKKIKAVLQLCVTTTHSSSWITKAETKATHQEVQQYAATSERE